MVTALWRACVFIKGSKLRNRINKCMGTAHRKWVMYSCSLLFHTHTHTPTHTPQTSCFSAGEQNALSVHYVFGEMHFNMGT